LQDRRNHRVAGADDDLDLAAHHRLYRDAARADLKQLHVHSVFLKGAGLFGHPDTGENRTDRRINDPHSRHLRRCRN
jgi:hypothetical protein